MTKPTATRFAFQVVQEPAAERGPVHRPARGMHDPAGLCLVRGDLPQFLDADGVGLRVLAFGQPKALKQLPAELAARAFRENRVAAGQLHAELEGILRLAVLADPHVAGRDAAHRAVFAVEDFCGCESRKDLDPERLGLFGEPFHHIAQPDDIAPMVVEVARHQKVRDAARAVFAQKEDIVSSDRLVQRRAALLPVGKELGQRPRVHHRAGQDMRAGLGPFLEHDDGKIRVELFEMDRRRQPGRSRPDDHHVIGHQLARPELFQNFFRRHPCLALIPSHAFPPVIRFRICANLPKIAGGGCHGKIVHV